MHHYKTVKEHIRQLEQNIMDQQHDPHETTQEKYIKADERAQLAVARAANHTNEDTEEEAWQEAYTQTKERANRNMDIAWRLKGKEIAKWVHQAIQGSMTGAHRHLRQEEQLPPLTHHILNPATGRACRTKQEAVNARSNKWKEIWEKEKANIDQIVAQIQEARRVVLESDEKPEAITVDHINKGLHLMRPNTGRACDH